MTKKIKNQRLDEVKKFIENELNYPYEGQEFKYSDDGENQIKIVSDCWTLTLFLNPWDIEVTTKGCYCLGPYDCEFFLDIYHNLDWISKIYNG